MAITRPQNYTVNRAAFITTFLQDLEKPYKGFLQSQLDEVVMKNEAISGAPCYYLGDTVYARGLTVAKIGKLKLGGLAVLDPSLFGLHEEWQEHYTGHNTGWTRFSQSLKLILMAAPSWQDLRDMLPDFVLKPYLDGWGFTGLTRTRPSLQDCLPHPTILPELRRIDMYQQEWVPDPVWDPRLVLQYGAIKDQLATYVGYRLV